MDRILLDFFGTVIEVSTKNELLLGRISYIFRCYIVKGRVPEIFFDLSIQDESKSEEIVLKGLLTSALMNVKYSYDGVIYQDWLFNDTFLPPLQIAPLAGRFLVLHGCAVRKNNKTIVFLAPSLAGKTSLTLYLLNRGYKCVSDDLIFIENEKIFTYKKPIGIRETGFGVIPDLEEITFQHVTNETMIFENLEGEKTWLMHMDDLFDKPYDDKSGKVDYIFWPDKSILGKSQKMSSFDAYEAIAKSVCNSGMNNELLMNNIIGLLSNLQGCYTLPTLNLEEAFNEINNVL